VRYLWDAIKTRFESDQQLVALARKIYLGHDADRLQSTLPYVECTYSVPGVESTFGQNTIEEYEVELTVFTKRETPENCLDILEALFNCFDWCDLSHAAFHTLAVTRIGGEGPTLEDAVYSAAVGYAIRIERVQPVPPSGVLVADVHGGGA
jgi:hypothetical protein